MLTVERLSQGSRSDTHSSGHDGVKDTHPGHHRVDSCEVCLASRASVNALTREISAIAHAHDGGSQITNAYGAMSEL